MAHCQKLTCFVFPDVCVCGEREQCTERGDELCPGTCPFVSALLIKC